jgi:MFS superfamily sulfate permease-like transporter
MSDMNEPLVHGQSAPAPDKTALDFVKGRARTLVRFLFIEIYTNEWKNDRAAFWGRMQSDVIAGITVGVMAVPQAMSYATVAGLEPVYGLYNAFVGIIPYPIFGTSPQLVTGPTAVMSIMVKQSIPAVIGGNVVSDELHMYLAFLLSFFAGVLQLILGFFDLGYLVNLVSEPVIGGFTSAAAFLIMATQLATLLGVPKCKGAAGHSCTVVESIQNIFTHADAINPGTPVCALFAISLLLFFKFKLKFSKIKPLKFLGNFGPLVLIVICIPLAISLDGKDGGHNTCVINNKHPQVKGKCPVSMWKIKGNGLSVEESKIRYPYTWIAHEGHKMEAGCCYDRDPFEESKNGDYDYSKTVHVFDKR